MAFSFLHWQHNVESTRRFGTESETTTDRFFARRYAIAATRACLIEAQTELETYPADHAHWRSYGHDDIECFIRMMQVALDDFEWNDSHKM